jgi:hypothetical protein
MTVIGVNHVQPVDTDHRRRIVGDRFGGDIAMSKPPRLRQQRRSLELTVGVCHPLRGEPDVGLLEKCCKRPVRKLLDTVTGPLPLVAEHLDQAHRPARLHPLPETNLAPDLEQQRERAAKQALLDQAW